MPRHPASDPRHEVSMQKHSALDEVMASKPVPKHGLSPLIAKHRGGILLEDSQASQSHFAVDHVCLPAHPPLLSTVRVTHYIKGSGHRGIATCVRQPVTTSSYWKRGPRGRQSERGGRGCFMWLLAHLAQRRARFPPRRLVSSWVASESSLIPPSLTWRVGGGTGWVCGGRPVAGGGYRVPKSGATGFNSVAR